MEDEILNPEVPEVEAEVVGENPTAEATVEGDFEEAVEVPAVEEGSGELATPEEVATEEAQPEIQPE